MRYWRHYPRFLQLLLLLLMVFTLVSFSGAVAEFLSVKLFGYNIAQLRGLDKNSPEGMIRATKMVQAIGNMLFFLCSALLFAYLTHPRPLGYLGFRNVQQKIHFLIVPLLMVSSSLVLLQLGDWSEYLPFSKAARTAHLEGIEKTKLLLRMDSPGDLLVNLLIMALIPAVGEELMFRGIIMRFAYNSSRNMIVAITISSVIFGLAHSDTYTLIPIILAGMLLGYIYYITGSIWFSIIAHLLHNGLQIIGLYFLKEDKIPDNASMPIAVFFLALIFAAACFLWLRRKATPLPAGWSNDFEDAVA